MRLILKPRDWEDLGEFDGLARAGGAADHSGLSNSLKSGGIPAADVPPRRSA